MAIVAHYFTRFECDRFYHVYNRSVDRQPMFKSRDNYLYFLKRYHHYLSGCADTYAYNLLGNHFHLLIKIHSEQALKSFQKENKKDEEKSSHDIVSHQFRKLFQSYALAFNKQHNRIGTLFQKPFKRALIDNISYLQNTLTYIHQNAQHHGLVKDFRDWEWSSYHAYLSKMPSEVCREDMLRLYTDKDNFTSKHSELLTAAAFAAIEW